MYKKTTVAGLTAIGAAWLWSLCARPASASARTASVSHDVDTLPLLAAMGVGIAVAVIAVIAFLQMTTKAKNAREDYGEADDEEEERLPQAAAEETRLPQPDDFADEAAGSSGERMPDYTMPLPSLPPLPATAEPAKDGAPSVWGVDGEFAGSGYRVPERWLTLGRDPSLCGIVFPYDAGEVSRKHCSLRYERERGLFLLEDHGSSNGTFGADGERLVPGIVYELKPGSRFALSGARHWFEVHV